MSYVQYWLVAALLLTLAIIGWDYGFFVWAYERFGDPKIVIAATALLSIFLWAFVVVGHRVALQLYRDDLILRKFLEAPLNSSLPIKGSVSAVRGMFETFDLNRDRRWIRNSIVWRSISSLATRIRVMGEVKTYEPVNRSMFQDYFEIDLAHGLAVLEKFQWILFNVGFLGTLIGIILALAGQNVPANVEEIREFSFGILSGAGLAYTTSALGIGGGLIIFVLHGLLWGCANSISARFRNKMFEVVFPVIHSEEFGYREIAHTESDHAAEEK